MDDRVSSVRATPPGDVSADLSDLGSEISAQLDRARMADERIHRVRARLASGQPSNFHREPKRRIRPIAIVSIFALAATVLLGIGYGVARAGKSADAKTAKARETTPPISFTVGSTAKLGATGGFIAAKEETPINFSDGSELRLAPAARVRVTEVANNGAHVLVENGSLHVSVVHRAETRWAIEAGPYEVKVTGTKFTVAWDAPKNALVVRMEEGSVVVGGCGLDKGTRLGAGQELVVSCSEHDKASTLELPSAAPSDVPPPVVVAKAKPVVDPTRNIVLLAQNGHHAEAIAAAEANGWDDTLGSLSGGELLLLANAGRYAGRFELASAALETARRRFPDTDSAATAAFELGRIAMDIRHQLGVAGDHFEVYLRERPDGVLAREACGRAIEARNGAGDRDRAQRLAVRYLSSWPDGPHAALARKLVGDKR